MRPSLPRRDGVGATDAESRGVCAFGLMERLVRVERPGGSIDGVGNDFQSFRNQRLGDGGPDLSQMEPTDQLDASNRRLPPGRVRRSLNRPGRSAPSRTAPSLAVSVRKPPERDSVLACPICRSPTRSLHNLQHRLHRIPGSGRACAEEHSGEEGADQGRFGLGGWTRWLRRTGVWFAVVSNSSRSSAGLQGPMT